MSDGGGPGIFADEIDLVFADQSMQVLWRRRLDQ